MKKVISINVGGSAFTIEEEAYEKLQNYLDCWESTISNKAEAKEVMEDIELRIAEIFRETVRYDYQVVNEKMVESLMAQMGQPEGAEPQAEKQQRQGGYTPRVAKRLYRNPDDRVVAGVCGGLAAYLDMDTAIIRIIMLVCVLSGVSLMLYFVLWICVPKAKTVAEKLEMRGEPVTAENIKNYSSKYAK